MNLPEGKFGAILIDPPWAFRTFGGADVTPHRTAVDHYPTMQLADIVKLPIGDVTAKDCALFMWVIDSHLDQAFDLAKSWGFKFKTRAFTWRKLTKASAARMEAGADVEEDEARIGMGYWTRKQTEMCWLFTRGKPSRLNKGVREIIDAPRREHSRKPDEQYPRIEALVGGPYLEIFARQSREGWSSWGNEVTRFDRPMRPPDDLDLLLGGTPDLADLLG